MAPTSLPWRERIEFLRRAASHIAAHPTEASTLPRWLAQRAASPVELRIPWWPYTLPPWIAAQLPDGARVFEYGAGGSTLWLEDRGFQVTSVESDPEWYAALSRAVRRPTTNLALVEAAAIGTVTSAVEPGYFDSYLAHIDSIADATLDLAIVDGRCRVEAGRRAIPKITPGGFLLLDDSDRERYSPLVRSLTGWRVHVFVALRPGGIPPGPTSIWRKP